MALKRNKSPLTNRTNPPQPRRHWIWTEPGPYHGIYTQNQEALLRLLHHPGRLLRLESGGFCLIFEKAVTLDPAEISAVPLRRLRLDSYTSYEPDKTPRRGVSIMIQGEPNLFSLETATPVDPIEFWDFSNVAMIKGHPLPASQLALPKIRNPRKDKPQSENAVLQSIVDEGEPFRDIKTQIESTQDRNKAGITNDAGYFMLRLLTTLLIIATFAAIIILVLGLAVSTIGSGNGIGPFGLMFVIAFLLWISGFFGHQTVKTSSGSTPKGVQKGRGKARKRGGLFEKLHGLALWNTSLGNNLRREIQRHLEQVNSMIDRGDIDRALKRAMSLASSEQEARKQKASLITKPPKPRASLDFNLERDSSTMTTIPGDWGFDKLRGKYKKLAEDLSAQGDHRRAAFIYAELLDLVKPALVELEKMKAYEDAAKLATARKESGPTVARLWFLAGRKDIALLIARRHNCMAELAAASQGDSDFSNFVRKHWIDDLIAEGDLPRAVKESADIPDLAETHLSVLAKAIGGGHLQDYPVLERAVQSLPWSIDTLNHAPIGETVGALIGQTIHTGITQPDAGNIRHALKLATERLDEKDPRKPALADAVIRASLAFDAETAFALSATNLRLFAQAQGCTALAEDLRQINRAAPSKQRLSQVTPLPRQGLGTWTMVAALHRGAALLGAPTGEIAMMDPQGIKRWADHLPDLVGMVPIGSGRLVLLIQGHDINRRVCVLDTALRTYRSLGSINLITWDRYAGDGIWQIQTPDAIGACDLVKLLDDRPNFEMLWSITQTIPVKVIAFSHNVSSASWLTQRIETDGPALIERWQITRATLAMSVSLANKTTEDKLTSQPHIWQSNSFKRLASNKSQTGMFGFHGQLSNHDAEQARRKEARDSNWTHGSLTKVITAPDEGAYTTEHSESDQSTIKLTESGGKKTAYIEGHHIVTQSSSRNGEYLIILTDSGFVLLCDFKTMRVLAV